MNANWSRRHTALAQLLIDLPGKKIYLFMMITYETGENDKKMKGGEDDKGQKGKESKVSSDAASSEEHFVVPVDYHGARLDKSVAHLTSGLSRSVIAEMIAAGQVKLNGLPVTEKCHKVKTGDKVRLKVDTHPAAHNRGYTHKINEECTKYSARNTPLFQSVRPEANSYGSDRSGKTREADPFCEILAEDKHILVINKPAGLVVHPGAGQTGTTLSEMLVHRYGKEISGVGQPDRPGIVHRLDKETSGAMLVAKSAQAYKVLTEDLAHHEISRTYHALLWGVPLLAAGQIEQPVGRHPSRRTKMAVHDNGRYALSAYKIINTYRENLTLAEFRLHTGRTHQIRVHAQYIGHPVVGDPLYKIQKTKETSLLKKMEIPADLAAALSSFQRQALHALELQFTHPESKNDIKVHAPYPSDFKEIIERLSPFLD